MGSCFSKRKRSDATVTHNASPRSSFSLSCKSDVATAAAPLRAQKPSDEIVVVVSKDSAPLLANTQNSHALKKSQSAKATCAQTMETEIAKAFLEEKGYKLQSPSQRKTVTDCDNHASVQNTESDYSGSHSTEASVDKKPINQDSTDKVVQCCYGPDTSAVDANGQTTCTKSTDDVTKRCTGPPSRDVFAEAIGCIVEDKEVLPSIVKEFVIEADDGGASIPCSMAKLKRSRSCEETIRPLQTKGPPGRRLSQDNYTFILNAPTLETILEPPQFGTTKFLEGLDLVDVLPNRLSHGEVEEELKPALLDLSHRKSHDLKADFFAFKDRYLSSCALSSQNSLPSGGCTQADDGKVGTYDVGGDAEDDMSESFGLMHSRASSMDSSEHIDMMSLYSSHRHPIPVVQEEDEHECGSDDSETFEFKHAVSIHEDVLNQRGPQLRDRAADKAGESKGVSFGRLNEKNELGSSKERSGFTRHKELSVVATGDALLYTGSNSEEFDLIPSKSYVRGSPKRISDTCTDMVATEQDTYYNWHRGHCEDDQEKQQQGSLSVDDIILLLEKDELDEEALLSFLNLAKSTTSSQGGNTPSWPASDVVSEASFEFKIKSSGSTPHSTPSTPMLSAGSTPKRITQLSPLALTSEEIAEIWGVFEQRQALSPFPSSTFS